MILTAALELSSSKTTVMCSSGGLSRPEETNRVKARA